MRDGIDIPTIEEVTSQAIDADVPVFGDNELTCAELYNGIWELTFADSLTPAPDVTSRVLAGVPEFITAVLYDRWARVADVDIDPELRARLDDIYQNDNVLLKDLPVLPRSEVDHNDEDNIFDDYLTFARYCGETIDYTISDINRSYCNNHNDPIIWMCGEREERSRPMFKESGFEIMLASVKGKLFQFFNSVQMVGIRAELRYRSDLRTQTIADIGTEITPTLSYESLMDSATAIIKDGCRMVSVQTTYTDDEYEDARGMLSPTITFDLNRCCALVVDSEEDEYAERNELCLLCEAFGLFPPECETVLVVYKTHGSSYEHLARKLIDALGIELITFAGSNYYHVDGMPDVIGDDDDDANGVERDSEEYYQRYADRFRCTHPAIFEYSYGKFYSSCWNYIGEWNEEVVDRLRKMYAAQQCFNMADMAYSDTSLSMLAASLNDDDIRTSFDCLKYIVEKLTFGHVKVTKDNVDVSGYVSCMGQLLMKMYGDVRPHGLYEEHAGSVEARAVDIFIELYTSQGVLSHDSWYYTRSYSEKELDESRLKSKIDAECEDAIECGIDSMYDAVERGVPIDDIIA